MALLVNREIWCAFCLVGRVMLTDPPVLSLGSITTPYHKSLVLLTDLTNQLRSHSVSFETSKDIINQWIEQPYLQEDGWHAQWEDLCEVEVEKWDAR